PDGAIIGVHDGVVGCVELLAVIFVRQHRYLAVVLVTNDLTCTVLAGDLPAFEIERIAVAVARGIAETAAHMAILLEPAQVLVVGNIAPDTIASDAAPRWPLGPQRAGVEPHDRRVAELGLEALVENHDVRI